MAPSATNRGRLLLIGFLIVLLTAAWFAGVPDMLFNGSLLEEKSMGTAIIFLAAFIVFGSLGVPPALLILACTAAWPFKHALPICYAGGLGAALLGFILARYLGRDYLAPRIPERIRKYESKLESHGLSTVIMLRLLFYLFPPVNWLLGVSNITTRTFIIGTMIGALPGTVVMTLSGRGLFAFLLKQPPGVIVASLLAAAVVITAWWRFVMKATQPDVDNNN